MLLTFLSSLGISVHVDKSTWDSTQFLEFVGPTSARSRHMPTCRRTGSKPYKSNFHGAFQSFCSGQDLPFCSWPPGGLHICDCLGPSLLRLSTTVVSESLFPHVPHHGLSAVGSQRYLFPPVVDGLRLGLRWDAILFALPMNNNHHGCVACRMGRPHE